MQKDELKQNVKNYAQKFEDGGLRLLKKGQKGIIHAIFSRFGLVLLLLLLQVGLLVSIFRWFGNLWPHYFGGSVAVTAVMVLYLLNSKMDNSAKITWMVVIALFPVVGVPLFFYVKSNFGHNILRKRLLELEDVLRTQLPQNQSVVQKLEASEPGAASLATYLYGRGGGFPVYENTAMTYFPSGEAKFEELLRQLETAEKYIFVEYFIIDEGLFWGRVLEVLARKAAAGVDVRVMYDGTCEFSTLPRDYPRRLEALGIQCKVFSPVQPFVSTHYNYRDHRKILVIDGRVGFTGGVNLADEYINQVEKYGRWKDAAIMLEGEAVRSLTALFLQMWCILKEPEFDAFLAEPIPVPENARGTAAPYGDCPLDGGRDGLHRPAQPGAAVHPHHDALSDFRRRAGNGPEVCRRARCGRSPHPAGHRGQKVCELAGQDPLFVPAGFGGEDQRVDAGLRPCKGLCRGRPGGRGGHHQPRLPQSVPPL